MPHELRVELFLAPAPLQGVDGVPVGFLRVPLPGRPGVLDHVSVGPLGDARDRVHLVLPARFLVRFPPLDGSPLLKTEDDDRCD